MQAAELPVEGFTYGALTPILGYAAACLGAALGLRCMLRAVTRSPKVRVRWLVLGAIGLGTGIWTMHFIAMLGFSVEGLDIDYDVPVTFASLAVSILVVGIGSFVVGYGGRGALPLMTGGLITGLGVAAMHYLGMAGMRFAGHISYDTTTLLMSIVIAVLAATGALWLAVTITGFSAAVGCSLIMGAAVCGMHYTGMAALRISAAPGTADGGSQPLAVLAPMLIGPVLLLFFVGLFVCMDPDPVAKERRRQRAERARVGYF
ncbi:MHYT domain-containing protein [Streptomyces boninensis]|uniref:MHYT domain-containing protein n=1 Tax=Streptomyces boninensis TaxID=2039455 RepID=UPI003B218D6F